MNCGDCKRPCNYPNADWFPPNAIKFCRLQVLFYLKDCDSIRQGEWPKEPNGSSYTDPAIRSNFVKIPALQAQLLASEVDARLKGWDLYEKKTGKFIKHVQGCGLEGKLLEYEVKLEYQLSPTSWQSLNYISGFDRKQQNYTQWKADANRRKTINNVVVKNNAK